MLGVVGLVAAGAVPAWMFRDLLAQVASSFQPDINWLLTGAIGFALMGAGLLPASRSCCRSAAPRTSRLYPRSRGTLAGWGVSLYLLGAMLLVQIGAIATTGSSPAAARKLPACPAFVSRPTPYSTR